MQMGIFLSQPSTHYIFWKLLKCTLSAVHFTEEEAEAYGEA